MAATRSTSIVVRQMLRAEEASDPPMAYRMPTRSSAAAISLSVPLSGSIGTPLFAEDLLELVSELALGNPKEDLAFAGAWVCLANASLAQIASRRRQLHGPVQLLFRRHFPHQAHEDLPCLRGCVGGPHS